MKSKYEHIVSINLVISNNNSDQTPSHKEIKKALDEYLKENPDLSKSVGLGTCEKYIDKYNEI